MASALKGVLVSEPPVPEGVVNIGGEWYYDEYAKGAGVSSVGLQDPAANAAQQPAVPGAPAAPISVLPPADEKKRILDLFKN